MIVGSGAREHAIAVRIKAEGNDVVSYQTHPNIGLRHICSSSIIQSGYDAKSVIDAAKLEKADIIVPGVEQVIFDGVADLAKKESISCYAPEREAARLESDKQFAKSIVGVIKPELIIPNMLARDVDAVIEFAKICDMSVVLKSLNDASKLEIKVFSGKTERRILLESAQRYIDSSGGVIIEKYIPGQDFSLYSFTNGKQIYFPKMVRDYPYKEEGDKGDKTGGMGCVSTEYLLPYVTENEYKKAQSCIAKTIAYLRDTIGITYQGILVGQFIKASDQIYFNEFDVRPGDPEIINVLHSLDTSFSDLITSTLSGTDLAEPKTNQYSVVSICHAPEDYPHSNTPTRFPLSFEEIEQNAVFVGDLDIKDGIAITGKGRSLVVSGIGKILEEARLGAIQRSEKLHSGLYYRKDIGKFAI